MGSIEEKAEIPRVTRESATASGVIQHIHNNGGVIIANFLSSDQVRRFNRELQPAIDKIEAGSKHESQRIKDFHGKQTKRVTNLVTHSETFRHEILDDDLAHEILEGIFVPESGTYWMTTAQVIEIGPGNAPQRLHRDLGNMPPYYDMGPAGPEGLINFLVALSDFTDENGATRMIPQSHKWSNFHDLGSPEMSIPVEMKAGDAFVFSAKVVHGGGGNRTDTYRRGMAFAFQPGFLTPEEAYPFMVDLNLAKTLSRRAQQMLGFRSQYPKGSPGVWQSDYHEIADVLGLN